MKILLTTMFSLITIMLLTNSISLAQQESDTEAGTTTPTTYRNNEGRLIYAKDNMPCYFFEEIVVEHAQYNYNANDNLLILQNAVVYSKCISNEGKEWLKGKKSPGAQDVSHLLDHKRPSYLIFRAQLIEKTINNEDPPIIIGWDNEIDGEIFKDFIDKGEDTINFDDIQESWDSEQGNCMKI